MDNLAKYTLIGGCALAAGNTKENAVVGLLYVKNTVQSKAFRPLDKNIVLAIFKNIRKNSYNIYKRLVMMHHQISQQFPNISPEEFKGIIEGPGSPLDLKGKLCEITENACEANGTTGTRELIQSPNSKLV